MENDMLQDFYVEAEELFDEAEDSLLAMEKSDDFTGCFNSVFRAFHSVKGAAGMFGLDKLQQHMHYIENLLEVRKGNTSLSAAMIDYLLLAVDTARKIVKGEEVSFDYYDPDAQGATASTEETSLSQEAKAQIQKQVNLRKQKQQSDGYVYIVDDESEILELTQDFLESENYRVKTFISAKELLVSLKSEVPDLIISDIKMPEMNGIELLREVNKIKPHLPVIVVSGYVTKDACLDAMACGVSGVLEKPFDTAQLLSMLDIFINRYRNIKLLNKSIDLLVYQFEDYDKYLLEKFGESKRDAFRQELKEILRQKKNLFENLI